MYQICLLGGIMLNGSNALQRFIQYWGPIDRKPAPVQKKCKMWIFAEKRQHTHKVVHIEILNLQFLAIWVVRAVRDFFFLISVKYPTFKIRGFLYFHGQNQYKVRIFVHFLGFSPWKKPLGLYHKSEKTQVATLKKFRFWIPDYFLGGNLEKSQVPP